MDQVRSMVSAIDTCGILLRFSEDVVNTFGSRLAAVILYGGAIEKGCRRKDEGDVDILILVYDSVGGDVNYETVVELVKKYYNIGYMISANVLLLSDFIKRLINGDSLAIKILVNGYPIIGKELINSFKRFIEINPPMLNNEYILRGVISLYQDAKALLEICRRDLVIICGYLKTAVGYILAIRSGTYDPDKATDIVHDEVSYVYITLKSYCKQALKGELSPRQLEDIITKIKELLNNTELYFNASQTKN